tara:strand:- start:270 stop:848 length:579 start_codon:yes stop_codon:yes gene_type:complete
LHDLIGNFVLGYHGCDTKTAETLLAGNDFKPSDNSFDWLGPGIYFWESNAVRALDFAGEMLKRKGRPVSDAAVVGAVISPGFTLDLLSKAGQEAVVSAHRELTQIFEVSESELPSNTPEPLLNYLDCAVIQHLHEVRKLADERPIQQVRGVFIEGKPLYDTSAFYSKTHIQLAVCDPACIKGVFRVRATDLE